MDSILETVDKDMNRWGLVDRYLVLKMDSYDRYGGDDGDGIGDGDDCAVKKMQKMERMTLAREIHNLEMKTRTRKMMMLLLLLRQRPKW